ncbi:MAG: hypothetical protein O7B25_10105 [Gammaproteobacteria bacterium]|nr:hypothetical protein [Gammaproteobacteria bacterium]
MNERLEMNTETFTECLDRWGSELDSWPSAQQSAAKELLITSKRATQLLGEARAMDRWLASAADHQAPSGLAAKIIDQIPGQDSWQSLLDWFSAALWRPALAAACMLLLGFATGLALPRINDDSMLDDLSMLAFNPTYEAAYSEFDNEQ